MNIDYNTKLGKIVVPGTYVFVWGSADAAATPDPAAALAAEGEDIQAGAYFNKTASSEDTWIAASTWDKLTAGIPYIKFVPEPSFTPAPAAVMATVYIDWQSGPAEWIGTGDLRLFVEYADGMIVPFSGGLGVACQRPSGWITPGPTIGGYRTLVDNWLPFTPDPEKVVVAYRLVFRNIDETMGARVKNFRILESVSNRPSGTGTIEEETISSVTYDLTVSGGLAASGRRAGIVGLEGWPHPLGIPFEVDLDGETTASGEVEFSDLPSGCLGTNLRVYDGYGNSAYIGGTVGAAKTDVAITFTRSPQTIDPDGIAHVTLSAEVGAVCEDEPQLRLYQLSVLRLYDDGLYYRELYQDTPRDVAESDELFVYASSFDPALGCAWKVQTTFSRYYPDIPREGGGTGVTIYWDAEELFFENDTTSPHIVGIGAKGWGSQIYVGLRATDSGGLDRAVFYNRRGHDFSGPWTVLATVAADEGGIFESNFAASIATPSGIETWDIYAVVYDTSGNQTTTETVRAISEGDAPKAPPTYVVSPDLKVYVINGGSVYLTWSSWDQFMQIVGYWRPVVKFDVYRWPAGHRPETPEPMSPRDGLPATTLSFLDDTIDEGGTYEYLIVGTDDLGGTKAIGGTANISTDGAVVTYIPFVEGYLGGLPHWMAAHPRNYKYDEVVENEQE